MNKLIEYHSDKTSDELAIIISHVPGMAKKTSLQFVKHLTEFILWMEEAGLQEKVYEKNITSDEIETNDKDHSLVGKKYVITGFRDKTLTAKLDSVGAIQMTTVSKNTDFVIVNSMDNKTSKVANAHRLNVKVISSEEIKDMF